MLYLVEYIVFERIRTLRTMIFCCSTRTVCPVSSNANFPPLCCFKQRFPSEKTDDDDDGEDVAKGEEGPARRLGGRRWYKANLKESGANRRRPGFRTP